jgi:small subunit ribosomal protein S17e
VKRVALELYESHGDEFTEDFSKNKEVVARLMEVKSKRLRNIIAGYVTRLKKREAKA